MILRKVPEAGAKVPRRGNRASTLTGRLILTLFGWRVQGNVPDLPKFVIVWAPHTSYWDWVICIGTLVAMRLNISWMAASELFWWPLGPFLSWLGGESIDRSAPHGVVDIMIRQFAEKTGFLLSIAPEGARAKVKRWKTGFYYIAKSASVPIVLISIDYNHKVIAIGPTFNTGPNAEHDIDLVRRHFQRVTAKHPDKSD